MGDIIARGATREVRLETHYVPAHETGSDRWIRLKLTGQLNRREFGIVWNTPFIGVSDDLTLALAVEAVPA